MFCVLNRSQSRNFVNFYIIRDYLVFWWTSVLYSIHPIYCFSFFFFCFLCFATFLQRQLNGFFVLNLPIPGVCRTGSFANYRRHLYTKLFCLLLYHSYFKSAADHRAPCFRPFSQDFQIFNLLFSWLALSVFSLYAIFFRGFQVLAAHGLFALHFGYLNSSSSVHFVSCFHILFLINFAF